MPRRGQPTGDLLCSASEAESAARLAETLPPVLLAGERATTRRISAGLRNATVFHFSGHAYSDHGDPDRSALLVAPADGTATDPFPDWTAAATRWHTTHDGWRTADIPGAGRLWERGHPAAGDLERRMERGSQPTLFARYADGQLGRLGEEWSVGDILALGERSACRLAFLSACSSGTAGGRSAYIDKYGGLPAALRLGGVTTLVCSLWEVDEGFTAPLSPGTPYQVKLPSTSSAARSTAARTARYSSSGWPGAARRPAPPAWGRLSCTRGTSRAGKPSCWRWPWSSWLSSPSRFR